MLYITIKFDILKMLVLKFLHIVCLLIFVIAVRFLYIVCFFFIVVLKFFI